MGQKCCRPKLRANFPMHIVTLNDIFNEAAQIQMIDKQTKKDLLSRQISEKINKKGHLKKLCDYLSSHHHFICQTVQMISRHMKNKKNPYYLVAASETSYRIVILTQQIRTLTTQDDEHKTIPRLTILKFYQEFSQNVFDLAFDLLEHYLHLSLEFVFRLDDSVENILSMMKEILYEEISTKIHHATIKKILDVVVEVMSSGKKHQKLCLEVYRKIIQKYNFVIVGASVYRNIVKEHLWKFLGLWVRQVSQYAKESSQIKPLKQKKSQDQMESMVDNVLLEGIFVQFFNSIFSYEESEYIYKELMSVYDTLSFGNMLIDIEGLVFSSLTRFQLKQQFLYRWFDYMLNYLAVTQDYYESVWNTSGFQHSYNYMKKKHKNILKQANSVGCLQTVRRWVEGGQIKVGTVLQYKSHKLLMSILLNLSNNDPNSEILDETCYTIEYLVNQHYLFYVELMSHIVTIISQLQAQYQSGNKNCPKYLEQLIKVISVLNPDKCLTLFQFEIQKLQQYERLYQIIFQPVKQSRIPINKYLMKATTQILKKIGVFSQANFDEKLCNYLGSIAKLIQEEKQPVKLKSIFIQASQLLLCLRSLAPYVLKPFMNHLRDIHEKTSSPNIVKLIAEVYGLLETPKKAQKILNPQKSHNYEQKLMSESKKIGKVKDKQGHNVEKMFENLNIENDIILEYGDRNSAVSGSFCGTSSVGHSDHNFTEMIMSIKKL